MDKKLTFSLLLFFAVATGTQVSKASEPQTHGWVSALVAHTHALFKQSKETLYSQGSQMLSQALRRGQSRIASIATQVWAYGPMGQRKQAFDSTIERIKQNIIEYAAVDAANQAYPAKLGRLQKSAERTAQSEKNKRSNAGNSSMLVQQQSPIVSDDESEDVGGSMQIMNSIATDQNTNRFANYQFAPDQNSPMVSRRESWYRSRSAWNGMSLRSAAQAEESADRYMKDLYTQAHIQILLTYMADAQKTNSDIYRLIPSYGLCIRVPHTAYDLDTGKYIVSPEELSHYGTRHDYTGRKLSDQAAAKVITVADVPTILGLTPKGKPFKNTDDFLTHNNGQGLALQNAYKLAERENRPEHKVETAKKQYQDYRKNITRFNPAVYNDYSDESKLSDIIKDYLKFRRMVHEENKKFRDGCTVVDSSGAEKQYAGWISLLKAEQEKIERQKAASAKRHYLW